MRCSAAQRRGAGACSSVSFRRSVSDRSRTPSGSGSAVSSRRRNTLTISTSWRLASSPAVVNVVRIVPPTAKAFMMRKRMVSGITLAAGL